MHPLIKQFFDDIAVNKYGLSAFCIKNALNYNTVKSWRRKTRRVTPSIESFNDVLAPLGYELQIVLKKEAFK